MEMDSNGMVVKRLSVPVGLEELMENLTKEVLLKKPKDIYAFASDYFAHLLALREQNKMKELNGSNKNFNKNLTSTGTTNTIVNEEQHSRQPSALKIRKATLCTINKPIKQTNIRSTSSGNLLTDLTRLNNKNDLLKKDLRSKTIFQKHKEIKSKNVAHDDTNDGGNRKTRIKNFNGNLSAKIKTDDNVAKVTPRSNSFGQFSNNRKGSSGSSPKSSYRNILTSTIKSKAEELVTKKQEVNNNDIKTANTKSSVLPANIEEGIMVVDGKSAKDSAKDNIESLKKESSISRADSSVKQSSCTELVTEADSNILKKQEVNAPIEAKIVGSTKDVVEADKQEQIYSNKLANAAAIEATDVVEIAKDKENSLTIDNSSKTSEIIENQNNKEDNLSSAKNDSIVPLKASGNDTEVNNIAEVMRKDKKDTNKSTKKREVSIEKFKTTEKEINTEKNLKIAKGEPSEVLKASEIDAEANNVTDCMRLEEINSKNLTTEPEVLIEMTEKEKSKEGTHKIEKDDSNKLAKTSVIVAEVNNVTKTMMDDKTDLKELRKDPEIVSEMSEMTETENSEQENLKLVKNDSNQIKVSKADAEANDVTNFVKNDETNQNNLTKEQEVETEKLETIEKEKGTKKPLKIEKADSTEGLKLSETDAEASHVTDSIENYERNLNNLTREPEVLTERSETTEKEKSTEKPLKIEKDDLSESLKAPETDVEASHVTDSIENYERNLNNLTKEPELLTERSETTEKEKSTEKPLKIEKDDLSEVLKASETDAEASHVTDSIENNERNLNNITKEPEVSTERSERTEKEKSTEKPLKIEKDNLSEALKASETDAEANHVTDSIENDERNLNNLTKKTEVSTERLETTGKEKSKAKIFKTERDDSSIAIKSSETDAEANDIADSIKKDETNLNKLTKEHEVSNERSEMHEKEKSTEKNVKIEKDDSSEVLKVSEIDAEAKAVTDSIKNGETNLNNLTKEHEVSAERSEMSEKEKTTEKNVKIEKNDSSEVLKVSETDAETKDVTDSIKNDETNLNNLTKEPEVSIETSETIEKAKSMEENLKIAKDDLSKSKIDAEDFMKNDKTNKLTEELEDSIETTEKEQSMEENQKIIKDDTSEVIKVPEIEDQTNLNKLTKDIDATNDDISEKLHADKIDLRSSAQKSEIVTETAKAYETNLKNATTESGTFEIAKDTNHLRAEENILPNISKESEINEAVTLNENDGDSNKVAKGTQLLKDKSEGIDVGKKEEDNLILQKNDLTTLVDETLVGGKTNLNNFANVPQTRLETSNTIEMTTKGKENNVKVQVEDTINLSRESENVVQDISGTAKKVTTNLNNALTDPATSDVAEITTVKKDDQKTDTQDLSNLTKETGIIVDVDDLPGNKYQDKRNANNLTKEPEDLSEVVDMTKEKEDNQKQDKNNELKGSEVVAEINNIDDTLKADVMNITIDKKDKMHDNKEALNKCETTAEIKDFAETTKEDKRDTNKEEVNKLTILPETYAIVEITKDAKDKQKDVTKPLSDHSNVSQIATEIKEFSKTIEGDEIAANKEANEPEISPEMSDNVETTKDSKDHTKELSNHSNVSKIDTEMKGFAETTKDDEIASKKGVKESEILPETSDKLETTKDSKDKQKDDTKDLSSNHQNLSETATKRKEFAETTEEDEFDSNMGLKASEISPEMSDKLESTTDSKDKQRDDTNELSNNQILSETVTKIKEFAETTEKNDIASNKVLKESEISPEVSDKRETTKDSKDNQTGDTKQLSDHPNLSETATKIKEFAVTTEKKEIASNKVIKEFEISPEMSDKLETTKASKDKQTDNTKVLSSNHQNLSETATKINEFAETTEEDEIASNKKIKESEISLDMSDKLETTKDSKDKQKDDTKELSNHQNLSKTATKIKEFAETTEEDEILSNKGIKEPEIASEISENVETTKESKENRKGDVENLIDQLNAPEIASEIKDSSESAKEDKCYTNKEAKEHQISVETSDTSEITSNTKDIRTVNTKKLSNHQNVPETAAEPEDIVEPLKKVKSDLNEEVKEAGITKDRDDKSDGFSKTSHVVQIAKTTKNDKLKTVKNGSINVTKGFIIPPENVIQKSTTQSENLKVTEKDSVKLAKEPIDSLDIIDVKVPEKMTESKIMKDEKMIEKQPEISAEITKDTQESRSADKIVTEQEEDNKFEENHVISSENKTNHEEINKEDVKTDNKYKTNNVNAKTLEESDKSVKTGNNNDEDIDAGVQTINAYKRLYGAEHDDVKSSEENVESPEPELQLNIVKSTLEPSTKLADQISNKEDNAESVKETEINTVKDDNSIAKEQTTDPKFEVSAENRKENKEDIDKVTRSTESAQKEIEQFVADDIEEGRSNKKKPPKEILDGNNQKKRHEIGILKTDKVLQDNGRVLNLTEQGAMTEPEITETKTTPHYKDSNAEELSFGVVADIAKDSDANKQKGITLEIDERNKNEISGTIKDSNLTLMDNKETGNNEEKIEKCTNIPQESVKANIGGSTENFKQTPDIAEKSIILNQADEKDDKGPSKENLKAAPPASVIENNKVESETNLNNLVSTKDDVKEDSDNRKQDKGLNHIIPADSDPEKSFIQENSNSTFNLLNEKDNAEKEIDHLQDAENKITVDTNKVQETSVGIVKTAETKEKNDAAQNASNIETLQKEVENLQKEPEIVTIANKKIRESTKDTNKVYPDIEKVDKNVEGISNHLIPVSKTQEDSDNLEEAKGDNKELMLQDHKEKVNEKAQSENLIESPNNLIADKADKEENYPESVKSAESDNIIGSALIESTRMENSENPAEKSEIIAEKEQISEKTMKQITDKNVSENKMTNELSKVAIISTTEIKQEKPVALDDDQIPKEIAAGKEILGNSEVPTETVKISTAEKDQQKHLTEKPEDKMKHIQANSHEIDTNSPNITEINAPIKVDASSNKENSDNSQIALNEDSLQAEKSESNIHDVTDRNVREIIETHSRKKRQVDDYNMEDTELNTKEENIGNKNKTVDKAKLPEEVSKEVASNDVSEETNTKLESEKSTSKSIKFGDAEEIVDGIADRKEINTSISNVRGILKNKSDESVVSNTDYNPEYEDDDSSSDKLEINNNTTNQIPETNENNPEEHGKLIDKLNVLENETVQFLQNLNRRKASDHAEEEMVKERTRNIQFPGRGEITPPPMLIRNDSTPLLATPDVESLEKMEEKGNDKKESDVAAKEESETRQGIATFLENVRYHKESGELLSSSTRENQTLNNKNNVTKSESKIGAVKVNDISNQMPVSTENKEQLTEASVLAEETHAAIEDKKDIQNEDKNKIDTKNVETKNDQQAIDESKTVTNTDKLIKNIEAEIIPKQEEVEEVIASKAIDLNEDLKKLKAQTHTFLDSVRYNKESSQSEEPNKRVVDEDLDETLKIMKKDLRHLSRIISQEDVLHHNSFESEENSISHGPESLIENIKDNLNELTDLISEDQEPDAGKTTTAESDEGGQQKETITNKSYDKVSELINKIEESQEELLSNLIEGGDKHEKGDIRESNQIKYDSPEVGEGNKESQNFIRETARFLENVKYNHSKDKEERTGKTFSPNHLPTYKVEILNLDGEKPEYMEAVGTLKDGEFVHTDLKRSNSVISDLESIKEEEEDDKSDKMACEDNKEQQTFNQDEGDELEATTKDAVEEDKRGTVGKTEDIYKDKKKHFQEQKQEDTKQIKKDKNQLSLEKHATYSSASEEVHLLPKTKELVNITDAIHSTSADVKLPESPETKSSSEDSSASDKTYVIDKQQNSKLTAKDDNSAEAAADSENIQSKQEDIKQSLQQQLAQNSKETIGVVNSDVKAFGEKEVINATAADNVAKMHKPKEVPLKDDSIETNDNKLEEQREQFKESSNSMQSKDSSQEDKKESKDSMPENSEQPNQADLTLDNEKEEISKELTKICKNAKQSTTNSTYLLKEGVVNEVLTPASETEDAKDSRVKNLQPFNEKLEKFEDENLKLKHVGDQKETTIKPLQDSAELNSKEKLEASTINKEEMSKQSVTHDLVSKKLKTSEESEEIDQKSIKKDTLTDDDVLKTQDTSVVDPNALKKPDGKSLLNQKGENITTEEETKQITTMNQQINYSDKANKLNITKAKKSAADSRQGTKIDNADRQRKEENLINQKTNDINLNNRNVGVEKLDCSITDTLDGIDSLKVDESTKSSFTDLDNEIKKDRVKRSLENDTNKMKIDKNDDKSLKNAHSLEETRRKSELFGQTIQKNDGIVEDLATTPNICYNRAASKIQKFWRTRRSKASPRKTIKELPDETYKNGLTEKELMKAATLIQALFRGYLTRKHINIMNYARNFDHSKFEDKLPTLMEISEEDDKTADSQLSSILKKDDVHLEEIKEKSEESAEDKKSTSSRQTGSKVEDEEVSTSSLMHSGELHDSIPIVEGNNQKKILSKDDTLEETSSGLLHSGEFHDDAGAFNSDFRQSFEELSKKTDKDEEEKSMSSLQHSSELHDIVPLPTIDAATEKEVKSHDKSSESLQHSSEMHDSLPLKETNKMDSIEKKSEEDSASSLVHSGEFHDVVPIDKETFTREMITAQESISGDLKPGIDENVETGIQRTESEQSKTNALEHTSELHDSLPLSDKKDVVKNPDEEEHSAASLLHSGEFHDFVPLPKNSIPKTTDEALTKQLTEDEVDDALGRLDKIIIPRDTPTPTDKLNNLQRSATVDEPPFEKKIAPTLIKSFSHCTEMPLENNAKLKEIEEEYEDVRKEMESIKNDVEKASEKSSSFNMHDLRKEIEAAGREFDEDKPNSASLIHSGELHDSAIIPKGKTIENVKENQIEEQKEKEKEKNVLEEDEKSASSLMHSGEFHDVMAFPEGIQKHVWAANDDDTSLDESSSILQSSDVPEVTANKPETKAEEKSINAATSGKLEHTSSISKQQNPVEEGKVNIDIKIQPASDELPSSDDSKKNLDETKLNDTAYLKRPISMESNASIDSTGTVIYQQEDTNVLKVPTEEHADAKVDVPKQVTPLVQRKESTDSENEAALRIQSNFRGYRVRKDLRRQGTEINLSSESESLKQSKDLPIHKGVMEYIDTITNPKINVDKPAETESLMHSGEFHDSAFTTKDYLSVKDNTEGDSDDDSQRSDKSSKSSRRSSFSIKNCMKEVAKPFKEAINTFYDKKEEKSAIVVPEQKEVVKEVEEDKPTEMIYIPLRDYSTDDETMTGIRKKNEEFDRMSLDSLECEEPKKTTIHIYSGDKKGPVEVSLDEHKKIDGSHVATIQISSSNVVVSGQSKESQQKSVDSGQKSLDDEEASLKTSSVNEGGRIGGSDRKKSVISEGLMGSGEFHDVVPLGLMNDKAKEEGTSETTNRNEEVTGNIVNHLPVQLPQSPAGVTLLTSQSEKGTSPVDVKKYNDVYDNNDADVYSNNDNNINRYEAQASNKDVSSNLYSATFHSNNYNEFSMETENRKNATIHNNKKDMEAEAATKIQAGFRGYKVRKQLKLKNGANDNMTNNRRAIRRKSSLVLSENGNIAQKQSKPSDLEEQSATKIQAGIRGFLVRRRQKKNNHNVQSF